jgi:hypothetical protein
VLLSKADLLILDATTSRHSRREIQAIVPPPAGIKRENFSRFASSSVSYAGVMLLFSGFLCAVDWGTKAIEEFYLLLFAR